MSRPLTSKMRREVAEGGRFGDEVKKSRAELSKLAKADSRDVPIVVDLDFNRMIHDSLELPSTVVSVSVCWGLAVNRSPESILDLISASIERQIQDLFDFPDSTQTTSFPPSECLYSLPPALLRCPVSLIFFRLPSPSTHSPPPVCSSPRYTFFLSILLLAVHSPSTTLICQTLDSDLKTRNSSQIQNTSPINSPSAASMHYDPERLLAAVIASSNSKVCISYPVQTF